MVRLGDVATFIRGITFRPTDVVDYGSPNSIRCMRTKNVQDQLALADVWSVDEKFVRRPEQRLRHGDTLISSANSWNLVGKCSWVPELDWPATFGGFVTVLRGHPDLVDARYLYHWFSAPQVQTLARSFGQQTTNISNLNLSRCMEMTLPVPSLGEQRRIATILDRADGLRGQRRETIAQFDQLRQAIFLDMFGGNDPVFSLWPTTRLGSIVSFLTSGSRGWARFYAEEGEKFLRIQNVRRDALSLDDVVYVHAPSNSEAKRTCVRAGDVLLSITADLGRVAVVPDNFGTAYINQHLAILRSSEISPRFLSSYLSSPSGQRQILARNRQGVKAGLNFDDIRSFMIPLPPSNLQKQYETAVSRVAEVQGAQNRQLAEAEAMFASLQQRAFAGAL